MVDKGAELTAVGCWKKKEACKWLAHYEACRAQFHSGRHEKQSREGERAEVELVQGQTSNLFYYGLKTWNG